MNTKTSLHPIVVLNFESRAVEETVIIGTGVDSAAGVNPVRGKKINVKPIIFRKRPNVCSMERVSGPKFGDPFRWRCT